MTQKHKPDWAERTTERLLRLEQKRPFHIKERIIVALRRARTLKEAERKVAEKRGYERRNKELEQRRKELFAPLPKEVLDESVKP